METFVVILLSVGVLRYFLKLGLNLIALVLPDNNKYLNYSRRTYALSLVENVIFLAAYIIALTHFA